MVDIKGVVKQAMEQDGTIWIYPMGAYGPELYSMIKVAFGYSKVQRIDNGLCLLVHDVLSLKEAADAFEENDILLLATKRTDVYGALRIEGVRDKIPFKNIISYFDGIEFVSDYHCDFHKHRISHLLYASDEVYRNDIKGNVAEAGVYKGDFAKYINELFPDRMLYLFDSFEGFNKEDVREGLDFEREYVPFMDKLKDTSASEVEMRMTYKDKIIIKKGYVPQTFHDVDDVFCFVSLDMDLYLPTYEALKFFWPRMSGGGVIFVHDFTWRETPGIIPAVKNFCEEVGAGYIRLADTATAALVKPYNHL